MRKVYVLFVVCVASATLVRSTAAAPKDMPCSGNACNDIKQNMGAMWKNVGKRNVTISWQPVVGLPGCGNWTSAVIAPGKAMNTNGVCNGVFRANY